MDKVILSATRRNPQEERARDVRDQDRIPVEYYAAGQENVSLSVGYQEFRKAFMAAGQSTVLELVIDGKEKKNVMIHEVDFHPVKDTIIHADLQGVVMTEKVTAPITLNFVGVSPAVKNLGGVLNISLEELEIECFPGDLVHHIDVDISGLETYHDAIHIKDLAIAQDSKYLLSNDLEDTICTISAPEDDSTEVDTSTLDPSAVPTERETKQGEVEA